MGFARSTHPTGIRFFKLNKRRVGKGALCAVPTIILEFYNLVGTLRFAHPTTRYFSVIASPLRSAFAINPTSRPDNSSTAPFWLVSTIARAPLPSASPAPAAP
jgi:hypothetical protein